MVKPGLLLCALTVLTASSALGARLSFQEHAAVQESLARVPTRVRVTVV